MNENGRFLDFPLYSFLIVITNWISVAFLTAYIFSHYGGASIGVQLPNCTDSLGEDKGNRRGVYIGQGVFVFFYLLLQYVNGALSLDRITNRIYVESLLDCCHSQRILVPLSHIHSNILASDTFSWFTHKANAIMIIPRKIAFALVSAFYKEVVCSSL